jgi:hypothetical protein
LDNNPDCQIIPLNFFLALLNSGGELIETFPADDFPAQYKKSFRAK